MNPVYSWPTPNGPKLHVMLKLSMHAINVGQPMKKPPEGGFRKPE
jgi:hypothetical protein